MALDQIALIGAGVFLGNMMSAAFIWGMSRAKNYKGADAPWLVIGAGLFPLSFFLLVAYTS